MQITPQSLESIFYSVNTLYQQAYKRAETWWARVAMEVKSTGAEERYGWMKDIPGMRKWVGDRVVHSLEASDYSIKNDDYEVTIGIKRNAIEDDKIGLYAPMLEMLGWNAKKHPDQIVAPLLKSGQTLLCFDGQPFFSASHPKGGAAGGTYQNYWNTGMALNAANFSIVKAAMGSYVSESGNPLAITPSLLVVPPALESTARQLMNAEIIAPAAAFGQNAAGGPQSNVLKGAADVLVIPELADAPTAWYLLDVTKPIKPFVFQNRKAPTTLALTDPTSDNVFKRKEYIYGADCRDAAGFALPFLAAKAVA